MSHDSPAPEPIPLTLSVPPRPERGLTDDLVRPVGPVHPEIEVVDLTASDAAVAEFLVRVAHSDSGFVARTDSGERAVGIIAATVAALMGEDIHSALANPDIDFLTGLKPPAVAALREVLLAIETGNQDAVTAALTVLTGDAPTA
ncbi:hypothetical protein [Nocardia otitidiscaviarum]|uniref:Uncharacterized protein n=1 Tax=Nocardia otitidiscaviarum TaxID=1823 RepID=A0A516NUA7_9NOCA|nr:hypothetical protein [Nocardia otitidiscaviarum]MBF6178830.1 hypothetical protein [Nocardia otitidiscaviarum]MCP9621884.1 hypothetical protein [Nocardia otitidiscaviarum]QDP82500.1 hypothetical protein FOH10_31015 [Nocardia otitidiscaviarum]